MPKNWSSFSGWPTLSILKGWGFDFSYVPWRKTAAATQRNADVHMNPLKRKLVDHPKD
jgi:hypothetical protein